MINSEKSLSCLKTHLTSELEKTLFDNFVLKDTDLKAEVLRRAILSKTSAEISALSNIIKSLLARGCEHDIQHVLKSLLNE